MFIGQVASFWESGLPSNSKQPGNSSHRLQHLLDYKVSLLMFSNTVTTIGRILAFSALSMTLLVGR